MDVPMDSGSPGSDWASSTVAAAPTPISGSAGHSPAVGRRSSRSPAASPDDDPVIPARARGNRAHGQETGGECVLGGGGGGMHRLLASGPPGANRFPQ